MLSVRKNVRALQYFLLGNISKKSERKEIANDKKGNQVLY